MKTFLLFTATKPVVIITSYDLVEHPDLLKKLESRGIRKFIAHEVSIESTKAKYGKCFDIVHNYLYVSEDLKILDYNVISASRKFSFNELGNPIFHDPDQILALAST